jgi:hypothetical protein
VVAGSRRLLDFLGIPGKKKAEGDKRYSSELGVRDRQYEHVEGAPYHGTEQLFFTLNRHLVGTGEFAGQIEGHGGEA